MSFGPDNLGEGGSITARVLVAAGRRIDGAEILVPRFALQAVPTVEVEIFNVLMRIRPTRVVCSAACGTDLLVLDAARQLTVPSDILLPFAPAEFREKSVADRPGLWGPKFDDLIANQPTGSRIEILSSNDQYNSDSAAYREITHALIERAAEAGGGDATALIAWDGKPTGADDQTEEFRKLVSSRGWRVIEIRTNAGRIP